MFRSLRRIVDHLDQHRSEGLRILGWNRPTPTRLLEQIRPLPPAAEDDRKSRCHHRQHLGGTGALEQRDVSERHDADIGRLIEDSNIFDRNRSQESHRMPEATLRYELFEGLELGPATGDQKGRWTFLDDEPHRLDRDRESLGHADGPGIRHHRLIPQTEGLPGAGTIAGPEHLGICAVR